MTGRFEHPGRTVAYFARAARFVAVLLAILVARPVPPAQAAAAASPAAVETQPAAWQHHHVNISYFGITTLYTCSGLESKVQAILEFLGARRGMTVHASGCMGPVDEPTRSAWVVADFDSPAPAVAGAPDVVAARWTAFKLNSRHPNFMGAGDCELMQAMKDTVEKNLASRALSYTTDCFPNEVHEGDFKVSGEALEVPAAGMK